jgi:hypothetical protein
MRELPQRDQRSAIGDRGRRRTDRRSLIADSVVVVLALLALSACSEVGSEPDVPASIEMTALPSPSVVIGDTLRNMDGVVTPIEAIVRNLDGNAITDAPVYYLYADYPRDSALAVDSASGIVVALKAANPATAQARLAARVGSSLQVLRSVLITERPDSTDRVGQSPLSLFYTTLPDTGRTGASLNRSTELTAIVRHMSSATTATGVNGWPVRFELITPANASNDTTRQVFLVDGTGRASVLDTTDQNGRAGRQVRIRADQYPAAGVIDTVVVHAVVTYKGKPLAGSPVRIALPVKRDTLPGVAAVRERGS